MEDIQSAALRHIQRSMKSGLLFCLAVILAGDLQLTLPPVVYATPDVQMSIYHDNIVLTEKPQDYRFEFECKLGTNEARRWTVKPTDADVGDHPLAITVKDASGKVLEQGKTTLHISPRKAGADKTLRLLIVGDSLTHATVYSQRDRQSALTSRQSEVDHARHAQTGQCFAHRRA
jgi:hypothetical protein